MSKLTARTKLDAHSVHKHLTTVGDVLRVSETKLQEIAYVGRYVRGECGTLLWRPSTSIFLDDLPGSSGFIDSSETVCPEAR
jgi:hypothetical protein